MRIYHPTIGEVWSKCRKLFEMDTVKQNRVRAWRFGCDIIISKNFWELKPGGDAKCEQRPFLSPFTIPDWEAVRKIAWELIPGGKRPKTGCWHFCLDEILSCWPGSSVRVFPHTGPRGAEQGGRWWQAELCPTNTLSLWHMCGSVTSPYICKDIQCVSGM